MHELKTILLTTDLSDSSRTAIEPATMLAKAFGAKVLLVHVGSLFPEVVLDPPLDLPALQNRQRELARENLKRFAAAELPRDIVLEQIVALGVPHVEILRLAAERRPELIVMATHGRGFISHAVLGSTAERVLRLASCPVLVVRDPGAKEQTTSREANALA